MPASDIAAKQARQDVRNRWLLSSPALFFIFIAAAGPLLIVLVYSFLAPGLYGDVKPEFSLAGWTNVLFERDIFDNTISLSEANLLVFWRSVKLSLVTTMATLFFGFPTAYFIVTRPQRSRELWLFLITIPFWTNLMIRTFAIMQIIRNDGVINKLLIATGITDQPLQIMFTDYAILAGMIYVYLPLMVLPLYASMEKFDFKFVEAGYDLYATRFKVLRRIIIPLVKPGIVAGSILVFIPSLGAYVTPSILGGGKNMMLGNLIELQFGQGRNWPLGSALSITLMMMVMIALLVYARNAGSKGFQHG